jgi:hypothetical protein
MDLDPIRLDFVPTARLRRLAMVAGLAVAMAVVTSHGELLVVAVVPLVLLVGVPRSGVPAAAEVSVSMSTARCVEGDEVELVLTVRADGCDRVQAEPVAPPWSELTYLGRQPGGARDGGPVDAGAGALGQAPGGAGPAQGARRRRGLPGPGGGRGR